MASGQAGEGESQEADARCRGGTVDGLDAGKEGGSRGHHVVDDEDVTADEGGGVVDIIDIAGVYPTCVGPTGGLGAVAADADKIVPYRQSNDISNPLGYCLGLVVAAPDELTPMERHRKQQVYTVKKSVGEYLAGKHSRDTTRHNRTRGILGLMYYRPIGTAVIIVEIACGTLDRHRPGDALMHGIERLAVNRRARQSRKAMHAHHLLAVTQRLAAHFAHMREQQSRHITEKLP